MKKTALILAMMVALLLTWTMGLAASAPDALQQLAAQYLPQNAQYRSFERENGQYELTFYLPDQAVLSEVKFWTDDQTVIHLEIGSSDERGGKNVTLTNAQAEAAVLAAYPEARITASLLKRDDGRNLYAVYIAWADTYGEISVHSETGEILEEERWMNATAIASSNGFAAPQQVISDVLKKAGSGVLVLFKLDMDDGRPVYSGEIHLDTQKIEFEVNAANGAVLEWDIDRLEDD